VLIPLASMRDCITYTSCEFDLIVYHSHDDDGVNLSDAIALREVFSSTPILVLSDASMLDHAVVRDVLDMGASGLVPTRRTGLGMPNKLIAAELGISVQTAKAHVCNTMRKMGAANRTQLAVSKL
jgi:DNA-binding NarL/FixJ family response regulator